MKRRAEGASWLDSRVSPSFLFFWGLVLAPALVLQDLLWLKAAQAGLLVLLCIAAGRLRSPAMLLGSLLFVAATVSVNLLSPLGRLLLRLGPLRVTAGALEAGLRKALGLLGLAYLSRLCVRADLSVPGTAGRYLRLMFGYLNALLANRPALVGKDLIARIDETLGALYGLDSGRPAVAGPGGRTTPLAAILLATLAATAWLSAVCPI